MTKNMPQTSKSLLAVTLVKIGRWLISYVTRQANDHAFILIRITGFSFYI